MADLTGCVADLTGADCVTGSEAGATVGTGEGVGLTVGTGEDGSVALTSIGPTLASTVPDGVTPTPTVGTNEPQAAALVAKKHTRADKQKPTGILCLRAAMRGRQYLSIPTQSIPPIAAFIHANRTCRHPDHAGVGPPRRVEVAAGRYRGLPQLGPSGSLPLAVRASTSDPPRPRSRARARRGA